MFSKNSVVIPLAGPEGSSSSIGNQLFQLAYGLYLKYQFNLEIQFYMRKDSSQNPLFARNQAANEVIASLAVPDKLIPTNVGFDLLIRLASLLPNLTYDEQFFKKKLDHKGEATRCKFLVKGYFQNYSYAERVKDELLSRFRNSVFFSSIFKTNTAQIAVHVRFGDYLSKQENHSIYGLVKPDYYVNAIRYLSDKTGVSHVCIVSDEPEQAVALLTPALSLLPDITLHSSHGSTLEYFCILASSKALVTTNSTFSWWAAWLAHMQNSATVIFPTPWFVDSRESAGLAYPTWIPLNRDSN